MNGVNNMKWMSVLFVFLSGCGYNYFTDDYVEYNLRRECVHICYPFRVDYVQYPNLCYCKGK